MSRRRSPREADLFAELPPISYVWQTPIRRPRPTEWDIPDVARSGRLIPAMRAKLERIVKRAPEVMVKITGRTKSVEHLKSHLEYITRNGELAGETEQGALLVGRVGLNDLQSRWADDAALDDRRRRDGSLSVNIILSMPAGTDAAAVKDSARAFALETFGHNTREFIERFSTRTGMTSRMSLRRGVRLAPFSVTAFGAPYIEKIRANKALSGALAAITAAVVGVILNLAIWFGIHTIFRKTVAVDGYGLSFDAPRDRKHGFLESRPLGRCGGRNLPFQDGHAPDPGGLLRGRNGIVSRGGDLANQ